MDQEVLVRERVDEGGRLVGRLRQEGFDVQGAFWLHDSEAGRWRLYLVTDETARGAAAAYKAVQQTFLELQPTYLDPFEITLTSQSDPRVAAIRDFQAKHPAPLATSVRNQYLGKVYFDEAYLYPPLTTP